jgi:hypothetical protein
VADIAGLDQNLRDRALMMVSARDARGPQEARDLFGQETEVSDARSNIPTSDGEEIPAGIRRWVEIETPSHDAVGVNRLVDVVAGDVVFGPGIYDKKAGSYIAYYALQHFVREGRRRRA